MTNSIMTRSISRSNVALEPAQILRYAPSVFATEKHESRGKHYKQFNTFEILKALHSEGWEVIQAIESNTRDESKQGFQKHMIRLRRKDDAAQLVNVGDTVFNLVVVNSHDGGSSYQLHAALMKLACTNGLIVSNRAFEPIRLRHAKLETDDVIEAQYRVLEQIPQIGQTVQDFQGIRLEEREKLAFARAAIDLRWDRDEQTEKSLAPVRAEQLLQVHRREDMASDLYTVYNVVQENLIRGGLQGRTQTGGYTTTRAVTGVDQNVKLNKALFTLAEEMRNIKG